MEKNGFPEREKWISRERKWISREKMDFLSKKWFPEKKLNFPKEKRDLLREKKNGFPIFFLTIFDKFNIFWLLATSTCWWQSTKSFHFSEIKVTSPTTNIHLDDDISARRLSAWYIYQLSLLHSYFWPVMFMCCPLEAGPAKRPSTVPPENIWLPEVGSLSEIRTSTFRVSCQPNPELNISTLSTVTEVP